MNYTCVQEVNDEWKSFIFRFPNVIYNDNAKLTSFCPIRPWAGIKRGGLSC